HRRAGACGRAVLGPDQGSPPRARGRGDPEHRAHAHGHPAPPRSVERARASRRAWICRKGRGRDLPRPGATLAHAMTDSFAEAVGSSAAQRASGSSFYTAMRILPRDEREAMFEIYSFCRAVDDVADDPGPRAPRVAALARWRADVNALYANNPPRRLQGLA